MLLFGALFSLKILQFYASPGEIFVGEQALLCYGVEDAVSVRIEPEVEKIKPALTRCIGVSPKRDTTYKFIAQGASQEKESREVRILVKPVPVPPPSISYFAPDGPFAKDGSVKLCFRLENASSVRVEPPVQVLGAAVSGCFVVKPGKSTTYTLIAAGAAGKTARKQVTVSVPSP
jgi:hypothetical protein